MWVNPLKKEVRKIKRLQKEMHKALKRIDKLEARLNKIPVRDDANANERVNTEEN